ncbi:MAG: hypothetical protein NZ932_04360 [Candidatus Bathyarchaeota archaeon]|nr:hypothetical protein [Candidatus Bathyarchaeota archaeon]MDW8040488.1 hypothetical protein [Nitrososphaerota archaeon]
MSYRERFSLRTLFLALVIVVVGVLLMLHGSNMLSEMNPLAIFVIGLAAVLIFSGITLIVVGVAGLASV